MRARTSLVALSCVCALAACGGGGGGGASLPPSSSGPPPVGTTPTAGLTPTPTPTARPTPTPTPTATPTPTTGSTTGPGQALTGPSTYSSLSYGTLWGPTALANAFGFPVQSGWNGSGDTVAVIMDAPFSMSDLQQYLSYFQIPQTNRTITVQIVDNGPSSNNGSQETTLDVETVAGLSPGANIIVYEIQTLNDSSGIDALNTIISDKTANVISYSAGGCESSADATSIAPIVQQAAAAGIALVASAGDYGADCNPTPPYRFGVLYPASDPNAIGVGGTETSTNLQDPINNPMAWNDFQAAGGSPEATGGGVSTLFALPSYQSGFSGSFRYVPDVAMPAGSDALFFNGQWVGINGTSWSAPQVAAMLAEMYQFCNTTFQVPVTMFYNADKQSGYNDFIDVTSGNNQWQGSPYYSAGPGFDAVSGIGIPLGMKVASTVCPGRVPAAVVRRARPESLYTEVATQIESPQLLRNLSDLGEASNTAQIRITLVLKPGEATNLSESAVVSALQGAGFTIVHRYRNHLVVDAEAPSSAVERFFATSIHNYNQGQYGTRYANATSLTIPRTLQGIISGVVANNLVTMTRL